MLEGEDARAVAKRLLRDKQAPEEEFNRVLHYPSCGAGVISWPWCAIGAASPPRRSYGPRGGPVYSSAEPPHPIRELT